MKKARLLAHFLDWDSFKDSEFPEISNVMHYFKETDEGKAEVKSVTEQWVEEGIKQGREEAILVLVKEGLLQEDVAASKLKINIEELQQKLKETED